MKAHVLTTDLVRALIQYIKDNDSESAYSDETCYDILNDYFYLYFFHETQYLNNQLVDNTDGFNLLYAELIQSEYDEIARDQFFELIENIYQLLVDPQTGIQLENMVSIEVRYPNKLLIMER